VQQGSKDTHAGLSFHVKPLLHANPESEAKWRPTFKHDFAESDTGTIARVHVLAFKSAKLNGKRLSKADKMLEASAARGVHTSDDTRAKNASPKTAPQKHHATMHETSSTVVEQRLLPQLFR
jgi:hypothetical protein